MRCWLTWKPLPWPTGAPNTYIFKFQCISEGGWQPGPVPLPARSRAAEGHSGSLSPGYRAPSWGWGWVTGLQVGPAWWVPWIGRAGLWEAGDLPCCSATMARADSPWHGILGPGQGWGTQGHWVGIVRIGSALTEIPWTVYAPFWIQFLFGYICADTWEGQGSS